MQEKERWVYGGVAETGSEEERKPMDKTGNGGDPVRSH